VAVSSSDSSAASFQLVVFINEVFIKLTDYFLIRLMKDNELELAAEESELDHRHAGERRRKKLHSSSSST